MAVRELKVPRHRWRAAVHLVALGGMWMALAGSASAQTGAPAAEEPLSLARLGLKGQLVLKHFSHFRETPTDNRNFREEGILQLEWARRLAPWADVKVVGEARADDDEHARGVTFQIPETAERRSLLGIREAVLGGRAGPVQVTLGKQFFAWGTADAWNPTDNLNPYDYLDPIDNEKLAVWSAAARLTVGPGSLHLVVIPFFTPSRTPLAGSRWVPPLPPGVVLDDREVPGREWENVQYGARAKVTVAGWDLSVSYFEGFEHTPVLRLSTVDLAPGVTVPRVTPIFTRMRVPGADFSTTFGKLEVHGEVAAKLVERDGPHDRLHGIVGVNYTWDELGLRWLEQVTLIAEYGREIILSESRSDIADPPNLNAFREALVGRIQWKFTEQTQLKLTGILDLTGPPNHYLQGKLSHKLTDALHVEAGLDFFTGGRETFYGRWKDNDRFFLTVKYYF